MPEARAVSGCAHGIERLTSHVTVTLPAGVSHGQPPSGILAHTTPDDLGDDVMARLRMLDERLDAGAHLTVA